MLGHGWVGAWSSVLAVACAATLLLRTMQREILETPTVEQIRLPMTACFSCRSTGFSFEAGQRESRNAAERVNADKRSTAGTWRLVRTGANQ